MIHILYECGICENLHPWDWSGDCREDDNRYANEEDYVERNGISLWNHDGTMAIEVRSMEERVEADLQEE